jgi:hypothetical protein
VSDGLLPAAKRAPYGAELYIEIGDGAKEAASPPMHGILYDALKGNLEGNLAGTRYPEYSFPPAYDISISQNEGNVLATANI